MIQQIGGGKWILYAHLKPRTVAARAGQTLRPGQRIGKLGNPGSSTSPQLHFSGDRLAVGAERDRAAVLFERQVLEGIVLGTRRGRNRTMRLAGRSGWTRRKLGPEDGKMPAETHVLGFT